MKSREYKYILVKNEIRKFKKHFHKRMMEELVKKYEEHSLHLIMYGEGVEYPANRVTILKEEKVNIDNLVAGMNLPGFH